jgi:hypothetical protein
LKLRLPLFRMQKSSGFPHFCSPDPSRVTSWGRKRHAEGMLIVEDAFAEIVLLEREKNKRYLPESVGALLARCLTKGRVTKRAYVGGHPKPAI